MRRLAGAVTVVAVAAAAVLTPSAAQAAGPYGAAFVWLDTPDAAMCIVPGERQWNSSAPFQFRNEVCGLDVGLYSVDLPGQAARAGTVQVTAYGSDTAYCKVQSWAPSGDNQRVLVRCLDRRGTPTDSRFVLTYNNRSGSGGKPLAYVFANQPTNASYTPPANYQYNSSGALNTITRSPGEPGVYTVNAPGIGTTGGHVQVTAYGTGGEWCTAWNWTASGTAERIQVRCYNAAGAPADSRFTMSFVKDGNIFGYGVCCSADGHPTSYLYANKPTVASYEPAAAYRFLSGTSGITRLGAGRYEVNYGWASVGGAVNVTSVGGNGARCKVESFESDEVAVVVCHNTAGTLADAPFLLHHVGPFVIG
ncbi:hypothetical protein BG844_18340 [Couchioplanes caeruleus subsp. caeruleus]|uniref:Uncharacterized protein n=1 Tax=Couchioplanes caeruleus subsp. caeruleus TaxID=56427 RepID=A0A1K0FJ71_9ACTN|nr:hypothetical protein BG844_18340 [Couchioplanes caeruleus subsp. caeruleus]